MRLSMMVRYFALIIHVFFGPTIVCPITPVTIIPAITTPVIIAPVITTPVIIALNLILPMILTVLPILTGNFQPMSRQCTD